jgi:hypothetical protein
LIASRFIPPRHLACIGTLGSEEDDEILGSEEDDIALVILSSTLLIVYAMQPSFHVPKHEVKEDPLSLPRKHVPPCDRGIILREPA